MLLCQVSYLRRKHKELKKQPADQPRTEDMITDEKVDLLDQLGLVTRPFSSCCMYYCL
jgi:hypothetical protein